MKVFVASARRLLAAPRARRLRRLVVIRAVVRTVTVAARSQVMVTVRRPALPSSEPLHTGGTAASSGGAVVFAGGVVVAVVVPVVGGVSTAVRITVAGRQAENPTSRRWRCSSPSR